MGLIGEFAAGPNAQCITALQGGLAYLKANKDVWTGALWWAAGPWWGTTTPYSVCMLKKSWCVDANNHRWNLPQARHSLTSFPRLFLTGNEVR